MNRCSLLALILVFAAAGGCGGGGGHDHHHPAVGSLLVSWDYDLFELAQALNTFGPCTDGLTDFWVELYDNSGLLVDEVLIDQYFDLFEILVVGHLKGSVRFAGLPPGNYEVRFVSGTILFEDLELYCWPDIVLFTLDLPSTYFLNVLPGLETHVFDEYAPVFVGVQ